MKKLFVFIMVSISVLFGPSVVTILPQVNTSDDAYHFNYFQNRRHDAFYIEWWYFNLFAEDIQVIFSYPVINPADILGNGLAGVTAVAYTENGIVSADIYFPPTHFDGSYHEADVIILDTNPNYVHANEDIDGSYQVGSYHIVGNVRGQHTISWDLMYDPQTDPWFALDREKVGTFRWEVMSWLVYMPGAWVTGTVTIDGKTYDISAPGYHDHNWGEWIQTNALWNWAQCYDPETSISFEMGDFRSKPAGVLSIEFEGERIVFQKDEYVLTHKRWEHDQKNKASFPVESWLYAENEDRSLFVRLYTIETEALFSPLKLAPFLPQLILYEQTAFYEGQLWDRNSLNRWELSASFSGNGFKEYTALKRPWMTTLGKRKNAIPLIKED